MYILIGKALKHFLYVRGKSNIMSTWTYILLLDI